MAAVFSDGWRGELVREAPLKQLNSWRVGGNAQQLYRPVGIEDLQCFLVSLSADEQVVWLGLGSNLLIRDGGIRGAVIAVHGALSGLTQTADSILRAEAGVPCAKVARYGAKRGLRGVEFLVGIPGTIGGALMMNAGAFGNETWQRVIGVETIDRCGITRFRKAIEFEVSYRKVTPPAKEWFLAAHLQLDRGDSAASLSRIKYLLGLRSERQPTGVASCGSVFRNPPGDYAARLIESAGLKNYSIGGAKVSEKHANFIINTGAARAADIEALISCIQRRVTRIYGIQLIPEVHIVGEPG